jgi:hypothetical protein
MFGAIEIRFRSGPVLLDSRYRITGEVVAVSQTPKTEVMWFDSRAYDASGKLVADMRMMLRQLKQSSPLYQARERTHDGARATSQARPALPGSATA